MYKRKLLAFATPAAILVAFAFATPAAATDTTTTTVAPPVTVTAWDDELTPVVYPTAPAPVVAVADPPVPVVVPPAAQGVLTSGQLPATGGGSDLLTWGAAVVMVAGLVMVLVARRRVL